MEDSCQRAPRHPLWAPQRRFFRDSQAPNPSLPAFLLQLLTGRALGFFSLFHTEEIVFTIFALPNCIDVGGSWMAGAQNKQLDWSVCHPSVSWLGAGSFHVGSQGGA